MDKKVLIGCPTCLKYEYCIDAYLKAINALEYKDFDILLVDNSKDDTYMNLLREKGINVIKGPRLEDVRDRIVASRNILREKFLEGKYEYLFSLEQDVIPKPDALSRLIAHNKEIVSAYYGSDVILELKDNQTGALKKVKINVPIAYLQDGNGIKRANAHEILKKGLLQIGAVGLGCLLLKREVVEKIPFRHEAEKVAYDDMFFSVDAKKAGFKLHIDGDVVMQHLK